LAATLAASTIVYLSSCGGKKGGGGAGSVSQTTGWEYNNPENGGFEVVDYTEQETGPGLVLIEGGAFQMGRVEQDVMYEWNNIQRKVTLPSFYMDITEVRNVDYLEYLTWIRRVYVEYPQVYKQALPDTLVWRRRLAYNEPYVEYYLRHPAYYEYPVVGVNWLQANDYCAWRTDRVNENLMVSRGILDHNPGDQVGNNNFNTEAYLAGQYEGLVRQNLPKMDGSGDRAVRMEDGIMLPRYTLPTEAQWEYAALALRENSEGSPERIWEYKLYPWNGHYLRNDSKQALGEFMANFKRGRGDMMGVAGALNDHGAITVPVDSYWPNDFGLYCMAGNVNEWCLDVYRQLSSRDLEEFNPFRGNVFQKMKTNTDGSAADKDSLGRVIFENVTDDYSRHNYQKSNNINYSDGDVQSAIIDGGGWMDESATAGSDRMYYAGVGDKGKDMTSLVSDRSRVYKGGGWNDRMYWLSPGTRRFLDERKSSENLGFRCAMTRVGSQPGF